MSAKVEGPSRGCFLSSRLDRMLHRPLLGLEIKDALDDFTEV